MRAEINPCGISIDHFGKFHQSKILFEIEDVVFAVRDMHGFEYANPRIVEKLAAGLPASMDEHIAKVPRYLSVFSDAHDYAETIDAFWAGCVDAGYLIDGFACNCPISDQVTPEDRIRFCYLISRIYNEVRSDEYLRRERRRRWDEDANKEDVSAYCDALTSAYSRILVSRLDCHYKKEFRDLITVDKVYRDRSAFIRILRNRAVFSDLIGYAWSIEQGFEAGYHLHVMAAFKGWKRQSDWYMTKVMGDFWEEVTDGAGYVYRCNDKIHQYKDRGVGMIHRNDAHERANFSKAIGYLRTLKTESERLQHPRMRPKGCDTFGRGNWPSRWSSFAQEGSQTLVQGNS